MNKVITALKNATLNKIDQVQANKAISTRQKGVSISASDVLAIASNKSPLVKLTQVTDVKLAAKHKARNIVKVAQTVAILPENSEVYTSSITNTAKQDSANSADAIEAYKPRESKYNHNDKAYSALTLKSNEEKEYLYTIQDKCTKSIMVDADTGKVMSKEEVAELCTKSAADKMLGLNKDEKTNKTYGITHDVVVRTIGMANVIKMEQVEF